MYLGECVRSEDNAPGIGSLHIVKAGSVSLAFAAVLGVKASPHPSSDPHLPSPQPS